MMNLVKIATAKRIATVEKIANAVVWTIKKKILLELSQLFTLLIPAYIRFNLHHSKQSTFQINTQVVPKRALT
jgi:hypothetical protein